LDSCFLAFFVYRLKPIRLWRGIKVQHQDVVSKAFEEEEIKVGDFTLIQSGMGGCSLRKEDKKILVDLKGYVFHFQLLLTGSLQISKDG
jgi:hypothetical protein